MSNHEQVQKANEQANEIWDKLPAWPVDKDGNFLSEDVVLYIQVQDTEKLPVVAASK